jgi:hypothetical protein
MQNNFQLVYPFSTEVINGYIDYLDLEDKSVLTVGSSLDQAFSAMIAGAFKITVYDICKNTKEFYKVKRDFILNHKREALFKLVMDYNQIPYTYDCLSKNIIYDSVPYLKDDASFDELKKKLVNPNIEFITGNIYEMDKTIPKRKFDRIILSNAVQYVDSYFSGNNISNFLDNKINEWLDHLNPDGILQLLYCYEFDTSYKLDDEDYFKFYRFKNNVLVHYNYLIHEFHDCVKLDNDAIIYIKKGK